MTRIDLDSLSVQDLKDLQRDVQKALANFEERRRKEALLALEETARGFGFTVADLVSLKAVRKRGPVAPKYANPENPADTWSGRGRKPRWFALAVASGKTQADLRM